MKYLRPLLFLFCFFCNSTLVGAQSINQDFNDFPFKPIDITVDSAREHLRIDVDQKNAFVDVSYEEEDYGYEYTSTFQFTYFVKADKSKVFALSHFSSGPSSDSKTVEFYSNINGEWQNLTPFIVPEVTLKDFDPESVWIDSVGSSYNIDITLPRQGTDLILKVMPVERYELPHDYTYDMYIASFPELILKWNREKGIFEKKKTSIQPKK